ncbi:hypothetical protein ABZ532_07095 [Streptomyces sp. NPDC019396]|uniref:hypothetical protein n=1 Tax=Streptomyces sp. NPDC019396 TaxID=3154687 RepID=UPI0033FD45F3
MSAPDHEATGPRARPLPAPSPSAVSMRDLLAACAAANAVSTPPREHKGAPGDPSGMAGYEEQRDAA